MTTRLRDRATDKHPRCARHVKRAVEPRPSDHLRGVWLWFQGHGLHRFASSRLQPYGRGSRQERRCLPHPGQWTGKTLHGASSLSDIDRGQTKQGVSRSIMPEEGHLAGFPSAIAWTGQRRDPSRCRRHSLGRLCPPCSPSRTSLARRDESILCYRAFSVPMDIQRAQVRPGSGVPISATDYLTKARRAHPKIRAAQQPYTSGGEVASALDAKTGQPRQYWSCRRRREGEHLFGQAYNGPCWESFSGPSGLSRSQERGCLAIPLPIWSFGTQ